MDFRLDAIYESGLLKLPQPLPLQDRSAVTVLIRTPPQSSVQKRLPTIATKDSILSEAWDIHCEQAATPNFVRWKSLRMQEVLSSIRKLAATDLPVLIVGESGTEKEIAALAIHLQSTRREGPFISTSCGGLPENVLDAELFGSVGAKPVGEVAVHSRLLAAEGGTLFLDEIQSLPAALQLKLLESLPAQIAQPVDGRRLVKTDARIIVGAPTDLNEAYTTGRLLRDLFNKLTVLQLKLPALREREADIQWLAVAFLGKYALQSGKGPFEFSKDSLRALQEHSWPGNTAELQNRIRRAVVMADRGRVEPADLDLKPPVRAAQGGTLREAREALDRRLVHEALRTHGGNVTLAATALGISRPTMYELMTKVGITKSAMPASSASSGNSYSQPP